MDFNLSEDDLYCISFADNPPNANIMHEVCSQKATYQDAPPPPPPSNSRTISNMLNDEAPDNFLSSAAIEKNIFSDDDEYGLQRLKKSDRNFEKPAWDNDFNTDDLIKKEPDLGLDLVNFEPAPPAASSGIDEFSKEDFSKDVGNGSLESKKLTSKENAVENGLSEESEGEDSDCGVFCEVTTYPTNSEKNEEYGVIEEVDNCMDFEDDNRSTKDPDNEGDDKYLLALNDHNYISFTSFGSVLQYVRYNMTAAERVRLLDLLTVKKVDNGALVAKLEPKDADLEASNDDASLATTESFYRSDEEEDNNSKDGSDEDGASDDQDMEDYEKSSSLRSEMKICKEELILNEEVEPSIQQKKRNQSMESLAESDETYEYRDEDDSENDEDAMPTENAPEKAMMNVKVEKDLSDIEDSQHSIAEQAKGLSATKSTTEDRLPVNENEITTEPNVEEEIRLNEENALNKGHAKSIESNDNEGENSLKTPLKDPLLENVDLLRKSSSGGASSVSVYFSENRSEHNEFLDTEETSSTLSNDTQKSSVPTERTVVKEEPKESTTREVDSEINEERNSNDKMSEPHSSSNLKVTNNVSAILTDKTESKKDEDEQDDNPLDNPKLNELKTFATRIYKFCKNPCAEDNLNGILEELLCDFREIVGRRSCVDKSMQTEKMYSKEKRTKMNEKAKRRLLNASSSSSDSSASSSEDEENETPYANQMDTGNDVGDLEEEADEINCDEEKLEKSPSYSDLSGRASSEEFLNTEMDEHEVQSNCSDVESSKYVPPSEKPSTQESDDLDLSKYEVKSDDAESSKVESKSTEESLSNKESVGTEKGETVEETSESNSEKNRMSDQIRLDENVLLNDSPGENYDDDEEMIERNKDPDTVDKENEAVEIASDVEISGFDDPADMEENIADEDGKLMRHLIENDEKLKSEAVVVVNKLSDDDLEEYYVDLGDKEIRRMLTYSGIIKKRTADIAQASGDKMIVSVRSKKTKKLLEILNETENDICSDESTSDVEEEKQTERHFLKDCNVKAKDDLLKSSSSDSESENKISDSEDMDDEEDEEGPSIVDKFLEKFTTIEENPEEPLVNDLDENVAMAKDGQSEVEKETQETPKIDKKNDVDIEKEPTSVPSEDFHLNESSDDSNDESSDDVVELNDDMSEVSKTKTNADNDKSTSSSEKSGISAPKAMSTSGLSRTIRNLLSGAKEIDLDALEKDPVKTMRDEDDVILDKSLSRKPTATKSLETLMEETHRRQNAKAADSTAVVTVDTDSDLEEISNEADVRKRSIKPMLRKDQLAGETRVAQRKENERLKRLERKNDMLTKMIDEHKRTINTNSEETQDDELILDYHSETKNFIKVHSDLVKYLKPHQIDGIKFMYDNTYGSVDNLKKHPGSGCILAHCMGLGKTLQIVALLHTVINYKELDTSKILVLCPKSTVMNWADEIRRWLGPIKCTNIKIFSFSDVTSSIEDKIKILREWASSGKPGFRKAGVLLLGYEAFRMLVFNPLHKKRIVSQAQTDKIKKVIRENLLEPGADLVICDEGHIIKNRKSATSSAVSEVSTPRRIILTGTPIQNNLKEYYAMVNFIKPKFLGTEKEFANLYENPIRNGQHKDSNKRDIKIMKQRSFVLHKKLSKFVQRREAALLKTFLPMKFEYVLFIPMTDVQSKLYEFFLEVSSKREGSKGKTLIPDYTCLRKIWTHPRVLENAWKNAMSKKRDTKKSPVRDPNSDDEVPDDVYDQQTGALSVTDDWWRSLLTPDNLSSILTSGKLQVMFEILRMCTDNGEKCLIFSAFVAVLDCVEYFMNEITKQSESAREYGLAKYRGPWESGKDYYRLDGKTPKSIRHEMVKRFNDPKVTRARVFLISAKAGGQGINLIGANRVIILDTSWNPSNDQQNIFRVFRLGQKRQCYIYRLLAMGTMEEKVYSRSVTKQAMSFRVVDEQQIDRHYSMAELTELYTLTKPDFQNRPVPLLPQDSILASLLRNSPHLVYKYHEHDSLLENKLEQELSEQEKADAWDAYERDLQSSQNPDFLTGLNSMPSLYPNAAFMPPGLGYGFHPDRNYPIGYGAGLPQGYLSSLGYSSNSSLLDMLKMYPTPPAMPGSLNPGAPGSSQGSLLHPYGPGLPPPNVPTSSPHPVNLPPFSSFQSMVASTGINSIPSFTSPYSTMANSYSLSTDPAFLRLSQMYASSLGGPSSSSSSLSPLDSRSASAVAHGSNSSATNQADKRNSPFPTGLMPPSTMSESIPTSVIKPPQAHSASNSRHSLPTPSLSQQLSSQLMPIQLAKPTNTGSADVPSLQQQLLAQSRLPPPGLPTLLPNHITNPRHSEVPFSKSESVSTTKAHSTTTTVASAVPSIMASLSTTSVNRNSSPVTVPQEKNPQVKNSSAVNTQRATNMGIVYPPDNNSATITPISPSVSAAGPTSNTISVRSVSSINNASSSKNTIPATIIPKPGATIPANISSLLKQSNVIPNSAISTNTSVTVSPVGKPQMSLGKSTSSLDKQQSSPNAPGNSLLAHLRQQTPLPPKDRVGVGVSPGATVDKAAMQILGTNNVQLTKLPNKRSVLSKSQKSLSANSASATQSTASRSKSSQGQIPSSSPNSVITKVRPNSGVTVLPVHSGSSANSGNSSTSGKMLQGVNVVPTLVPFNSKVNIPASTRPTMMTTGKIPVTIPTNVSVSSTGPNHLKLQSARGTNSPTALLKKSLSNVTRVGSPMAKPAQSQPAATTIPGNASVKRSISLTNLPTAKQTRPTVTSSQVSRQQSPMLSGHQHQRTTNIVPGKLQNSPSSTSSLSSSSSSVLGGVNSSKGSLSIRSIDTINKFANAGITISPGKSKTNSNQNVLGNVMNQGNTNVKLGNLSNSITLSKVVGPTARKRPSTNSLGSNSAAINQAKKPRITQPVTDRNVAESLLRARSSQGLTIMLKNPQGSSQKTNKDGKVTDVVEID